MARRNLRKGELAQRQLRLRRLLLIVGGLAVLYLVVPLLLGETGIISYFKLRRTERALTAEIETLAQQNQALTEEVRRLKSDPETIERVAREQLGLVRPGEVVYKFEPAPARANHDR
jgi:cell division protein FtsB